MSSHVDSNAKQKSCCSSKEDSIGLKVVYTSTNLVEATHKIMMGIQENNARHMVPSGKK